VAPPSHTLLLDDRNPVGRPAAVETEWHANRETHRRDRLSRKILALIAHFVRRFAERHGKKVEEVPDNVIAMLKHYPWPGNVRELQNVIERAVVATTSPTLRLSEPELRIDRAAAASRTLAQVERDHIVATLQATNWVLGGWNGAAARLGLSRTTLISKMQRLGISAGTRLRKSASQPAAAVGKRVQAQPQVQCTM